MGPSSEEGYWAGTEVEVKNGTGAGVQSKGGAVW